MPDDEGLQHRSTSSVDWKVGGDAGDPAEGDPADRSNRRKSFCGREKAVSLEGVKMAFSAIGNDQESLGSI